ncbi:MAG: hypothetical protein DMG30_06675 [Acidobacteria bacterium]|nr:MAG: hypothetical protein DMG30_06675 [Acidobacteriota bacterium]
MRQRPPRCSVVTINKPFAFRMEADMRRFLGPLVFLVLLAAIVPLPAFLWAQGPVQKGQAQRALDIYFIDTEGGQATLFVTPSGESMLVDTGFAANQGMPDATATSSSGAPITRDADRISTVFKQAGVTVLDWMVISHYHGDHVGNAAELASRIPVRHLHGSAGQRPRHGGEAGRQDPGARAGRRGRFFGRRIDQSSHARDAPAGGARRRLAQSALPGCQIEGTGSHAGEF